jgi:glycosyltransferase involved in cell wall biosynthesis
MKIAFVCDTVYPYMKGGAEKRIYEISKRIVKHGHEVSWFGIKWWKESSVTQNGVHLHGVCKARNLYTKEGKRKIKEAFYFSSRVFAPLLKKDFDIIDVSQFPYFPCFSTKIVSMLRREPIIITWHEIWGDYWNEYLGYKGHFGKFVERITARLSACNIAVSESTRRNLIRLGGKNIHLIPNGIDLEEIRKIPPAEKGYNILFAGRLIREKNVDKLISIIPEVKEDFRHIKCGIIGDGPEREKLMKLVNDLNLGNNIEFLGFLEYESLIAYMKSSDIFVFPSVREGFGIILLEAMAAGMPVLAVRSKYSAASDMLDGNNGLLCNLNELKDSISDLLSNESLRRKLIKGGYEYSKVMQWDRIAQEVLKVYENFANTS